MMPLRHPRQHAGGRPVRLRGQKSNKIGSMIAHSVSSTSQIVSSISVAIRASLLKLANDLHQPDRITKSSFEIVTKWRWAIQGNKIQWSGLKIGDVKLSFALNPVKSPKEIDLTFLDGPHKGKRLRGIYQFNPKGAWQICFADPDAKVERPTDVSYSTDEGRTMVVLKRPESQEPAADSPFKAETEETTPP
jgi:uncharacterized protein (TIGR03067 family)